MRNRNILSLGFDPLMINDQNLVSITKVNTVEEAIEKNQSIDFDAIVINQKIDAVEIQKLKKLLTFQQADLVFQVATDDNHFQEVVAMLLDQFKNQKRNYSFTDNAFAQLSIYQNN
ncbi:hypothetical protein [Chryseobacterium sp. T1]